MRILSRAVAVSDCDVWMSSPGARDGVRIISHGMRNGAKIGWVRSDHSLIWRPIRVLGLWSVTSSTTSGSPSVATDAPYNPTLSPIAIGHPKWRRDRSAPPRVGSDQKPETMLPCSRPSRTTTTPRRCIVEATRTPTATMTRCNRGRRAATSCALTIGECLRKRKRSRRW